MADIMEKIFLIAGCSHAAGSEINGQEDSVYNRQHAFGALVANHFGYRPINIAQNGMTNTGIARSVLKWFEKHYDPSKMKVFVLVAWTESTRLEVPMERDYYYDHCSKAADWFDGTANQYMRVTFGWEGGDPEERSIVPYYHKFMAQNETFLELQSIQLILQIQYFLKSINVGYLMSNSLHMFNKRTRQVEEFLSLVDRTKYYQMDNNEAAFYTKYKNLGYVNDLAKYWHHGEMPHICYADELVKYIEGQQWEL
jgi:hypothetical protein